MYSGEEGVSVELNEEKSDKPEVPPEERRKQKRIEKLEKRIGLL